MAISVVDALIDQLTPLDSLAELLQRQIGLLLERGGLTARRVKDLLNGVWFQHPLHPALTDVPIGAWTFAAVLDVASTADRRLAPAADTLLGLGCAGAVAAAATGLADWQDTYGSERRLGLAHALLNTTALSLSLVSLGCRRRGLRGFGRAISVSGFATALLASYLGGNLVFKLGTQVNHTAWLEAPEDWTPVAEEAEAVEGRLLRVNAGGTPVLIVRRDGRLRALCAVCSHAGGPLDEGKLDGDSVICPWHASQFDLASGRPIHGPASMAQPVYDLRVQAGKIEIRKPH